MEELSSLLWAYCTTPRASIGETPFSLMFGFEAVVPTELDLASYRVSNYNGQKIEGALRANLNLVEEKRDRTYIRMAAYKQKASQYYNSKLKHQSFQVRDVVLKAVNQSTKISNHGKLGANWIN